MSQPTQANIRTRIAYLLNDTGQAMYTNPVIDPAVEQAYFELQSEAQNHGFPLTINNYFTTAIAANAPTIPVTSLDMVYPLQLWSRNTGLTSETDWQPMIKTFELPLVESDTNLTYWCWTNVLSGAVHIPSIRFVPSTVAKDVKISYIQDFSPVAATLQPVGSFVFLTYRGAAIAAMVIGNDPERAQALNDAAQAELEKLINLNVRSNQNPIVRRRPYSIRRRLGWL